MTIITISANNRSRLAVEDIDASIEPGLIIKEDEVERTRKKLAEDFRKANDEYMGVDKKKKKDDKKPDVKGKKPAEKDDDAEDMDDEVEDKDAGAGGDGKSDKKKKPAKKSDDDEMDDSLEDL